MAPSLGGGKKATHKKNKRGNTVKAQYSILSDKKHHHTLVVVFIKDFLMKYYN